MNRLVVFGAAGALVVALLWVSPMIGLATLAAFLALVPPWGRTLSERAVISGVVVVGAVGIVFPRAGSTPIDPFTSRVLLTLVVAISIALYAIPALRGTRIPVVRVTDGFLLLIAAGIAFWLISSYWAANSEQLISGLFFSGWDNHGHFTTFANTYTAGSTTWPTVGGSIAWNQWYPVLHTTMWAVLEFASGHAGLGRVDLLFPFVQWSAVSFALAMAALAWLASDVAGRWASSYATRRWGQWAGVGAMLVAGAWILLGSPQFLYNAGFTNFVMAVSLVAVGSYLSIRSTRSARTLGWFVLPLAAIATIGLWTPLVVALVPAMVVVAVVLIRTKALWGALWIVAGILLGAVLTWQQGNAILSAEGDASPGDFAESIGSVGTGMAPFNYAAGLAAPFVAVVVAILLRGQRPMAYGVAAPSVMTGLLALAFVPGTDAAGVNRIQSYYVLKSLDAALIMTTPLLAAAASVGLMLLVRKAHVTDRVLISVLAVVVLVSAFGYLGPVPKNLSGSRYVAPGVQAGLDRTSAVEDSLIGESIMGTVTAIADLPDFAPMMWDGSGTLPNLWAASLHNTLSTRQQQYYIGLPTFPYGEDAYAYVKSQLEADPELRLALTWFRPVSGEFLNLRFGTADPRQATVVRVPMRQSLICPEC